MSKVKLYSKLFEAQKNFKRIIKDAVNPYFESKYADLNSLLDAVLPALTEQKLLLLQPTTGRDVSTVIVDTETGEEVRATLTMSDSLTDPQKILAATTYYRRGTLQCLLGLQAEDDDGNSIGEAATKKTEAKPVAKTETKTATADTGAFKRPLGKPASNGVTNGATKAKPASTVWDDG